MSSSKSSKSFVISCSKLSKNSFVVKSSSGSDYKVTIQPSGSVVCSCRGFVMRRRCQHADYVREKEFGSDAPLQAAAKVDSPYKFLNKYQQVIDNKISNILEKIKSRSN